VNTCWKFLLALAAALALTTSAAIPAAAPPGIAVAGSQLVDGSAAPLRIAGVNRSGSEYACAQGWGIFDGPVGCNTTTCWDGTVAPLAQQVPVVATEVGENDCAGGFLNTLLPWADSHQIGYVAWAWNASSCGDGPALISDYGGMPTAYWPAYKAYIGAPESQPLDPAARFDFEDGTTQGWGVSWGSTLSVSNETVTSYSGSHGLALDVSGTGWPAAGVSAGLGGVGAGAIVTYHVWAPSGVSAGVPPMLFDSGWHASVLANRQLQPGWNSVTFTVPPSTNGVNVLGLRVNDGSGWAGRLVLDDISWQPVRFDFEDRVHGQPRSGARRVGHRVARGRRQRWPGRRRGGRDRHLSRVGAAGCAGRRLPYVVRLRVAHARAGGPAATDRVEHGQLHDPSHDRRRRRAWPPGQRRERLGRPAGARLGGLLKRY